MPDANRSEPDAPSVVQREGHRVPVANAELYLERFSPPQSPSRGALLLVHGSVENGRIFYSRGGRGLAPYLASAGYDVFVMDLRGRGQSTPAISRTARFGQTEAITEDIPACLTYVRSRTHTPVGIVTHSWGGVLVMSMLLRRPELIADVHKVVHFATKRIISVRTLERLFKIDLGWNLIGALATRIYGYLPARRLGFGSDDETRRSHAECVRWVRGAPWVDPFDGFDYAAASRNVQLPKSLFVTGVNDTYLGHESDVRAFMHETGAPAELWLLGRAHGSRHNYGHLDILTHKDAPKDHFPRLLAWLSET